MAKRLGKLQAFLREQKLDALLIKSKTMKKYMDTLTGSGCQILLMRDRGFLIVDGRYLVEANEREHDLQIVQHMPHTGGNGYLGVVEELLHKHSCKSMGVESSQLLVKEYWRMEALGVDIRLLDEEIHMLRICKDEEEQRLMQEAVDITDDIYQRVIHHLHIGMSEYEISALLQYYAISAGAAQMSFETIVGTGERSALPHGRPTGRKIRAHEPILMDFGIQYKNYQSDMTRVCFIGKPKPEIGDIYHIVLEAQLAGIRAMKQGAVACEVDNAARAVITRAGYGEYFTHGLGHGLGIGDGCEYPILNETGTVVLQNGMMMSCEPGIYLPGIGGIRIEDDVVIRDGIDVAMNKTSKELLILKEDAVHEV